MALTNSQYETIIRNYEQTRDRNRYLLEARKEQVYQTIPEYWDLEDSVSSLSVSAAKAMLDGDGSAKENLHQSLIKIRRRQRELLSSAGFSASYLEPIYSCPICHDTGYIAGGNGVQEKCICFHQQEISILYAQSNIQNMIAQENFSTLSCKYYQGEDLQRFQAATELSKKFVQNFKQDYRNLFFYGTVGTGKSFLSGCIAEELLKQGHSVIYFSASDLFETLAHYSFDHKEKDALHNLYEDLYGCDLLIIDDLGTEVTNSFVASQLFSCLNERYLRRKSTIISTNLSLEELRDRYSDRIFSRITINFDLCKLTGPDIRILKKRLSNAQQNI